MEIKNFSFIKDEPILPGKPGYFDFYHKSFSPALKSMILSESCPHTIGLFSKWGTGKSSIIDQLDQDLKSEANTHVLIFDAWKYQEDSLRRTFLIKLEKFLKEKGYQIPENILSAFYKGKVSSISTTTEVESREEELKNGFLSRLWSNYKLPFIFLGIPFILGVTFYILGDYYPQNKWIGGAKSFSSYLNSLAWLGLLAGIFLKPVAEKALEKITSKIFESTKTYTEIRTQIENEERLNSPEQFEDVFTDLISHIDKGKLVIVFDNIDRVQGDVALKILSTIKTFLEVGKSKVIFLVPCDAGAINKQIRTFYNNQAVDDGDFDESEYLKKLFNVVINTPEFIDEDLYGYTEALIEETGDDLKLIIKNEQVLSVITKGFKNNPREIKQFINNLVSAVLVASKTEVAGHILSKENIGYFTKVTILKQKFPKAYKKLKENWNEPQKILDPKETDSQLRDFLTLTSTVNTSDAEPFIYFKKPQIEGGLQNATAIRHALINGNTEEFEKLASAETEKAKLIQYVARLLRNYRGQARILSLIFKTQIQGFSNLKETGNNTESYNDAIILALELIWNDYLELPTSAIFELLPRLNAERRNLIIEKYVSALANEEIRTTANKSFFHNLLDEIIKNLSLITPEQRTKILEAIRKDLEVRTDILLKFDTNEKQKDFIDPDVLRKIIQDVINNQNLKTYTPVLSLYQQFIIDNDLESPLLQRTPSLMSAQNAETPSTVTTKVEFYTSILTLFGNFKNGLKNIIVSDQKDIFTNLNNAYSQSNQTDALLHKIVIALRWIEASTTDATVKNQFQGLINTFISQSTKDSLGKVLAYWNESSRHNFIKDHIEHIKSKSLQDEGVFTVCYENGDDSQKLLLIQHIVANKPDHGLSFLATLGDKIPSRQRVVESLLAKAQTLSIQQRVDIFHFLQGKIAKNDDVNIKQTAIQQFYEYLKSNDQPMVQFGTVMLKETFLSDTDEREIAKDMIDFYNTRSSHVQQSDLPVIDHLVDIESKLQGALKEKLAFLILSNINHDRPAVIQRPLVALIRKLNLNTDDYEKDYSDLVQRLLTWPDSAQKDEVVIDIFELLKVVPGAKSKEYVETIKPLLKPVSN